MCTGVCVGGGGACVSSWFFFFLCVLFDYWLYFVKFTKYLYACMHLLVVRAFVYMHVSMDVRIY